MKVATFKLVPALLLVGVACGHNNPGPAGQVQTRQKMAARFDVAQDNDETPRRLESVTWNSVKHQLTWEISKTEDKEGSKEKEKAKADHYQIDMDKATMTFNGETRRFSELEAVNVRALMDVISKYAAESTLWWEQGEGEPVDGNGRPTDPPQPKKREKPDSGKSTVVTIRMPVAQLVASLERR